MSKLDQVQNVIVGHLLDIEKLFKPNVKLSFIARTPNDPERDILITGDDLDELTKLIERRKESRP